MSVWLCNINTNNRQSGWNSPETSDWSAQVVSSEPLFNVILPFTTWINVDYCFSPRGIQACNVSNLKPLLTFSISKMSVCCSPTKSQAIPRMWNKHVNPPSPDSAAWTQGVSWQTQHVYSLYRKKKRIALQIPCSPSQRSFLTWVVILPRASPIPSVKKTKKQKARRQRRQRRFTKHTLFVISVCVCVTWKKPEAEC